MFFKIKKFSKLFFKRRHHDHNYEDISHSQEKENLTPEERVCRRLKEMEERLELTKKITLYAKEKGIKEDEKIFAKLSRDLEEIMGMIDMINFDFLTFSEAEKICRKIFSEIKNRGYNSFL